MLPDIDHKSLSDCLYRQVELNITNDSIDETFKNGEQHKLNSELNHFDKNDPQSSSNTDNSNLTSKIMSKELAIAEFNDKNSKILIMSMTKKHMTCIMISINTGDMKNLKMK